MRQQKPQHFSARGTHERFITWTARVKNSPAPEANFFTLKSISFVYDLKHSRESTLTLSTRCCGRRQSHVTLPYVTRIILRK